MKQQVQQKQDRSRKFEGKLTGNTYSKELEDYLQGEEVIPIQNKSNTRDPYTPLKVFETPMPNSSKVAKSNHDNINIIRSRDDKGRLHGFTHDAKPTGELDNYPEGTKVISDKYIAKQKKTNNKTL